MQLLKVAILGIGVLLAFPVLGLCKVPSSVDLESIERVEESIQSSLKLDSIESPAQIVVVYFTPSDRKPAKDYRARLRRIVEEGARFYETELKRHGFADRKMRFLRNDQDQVRIVNVVGEDVEKNYNKADGGRIRKEIIPALRQEGIRPNQSVLLIVCNLMNYDKKRGRISHHSPYYGGGSHLAGNAWQCDSEILDTLRFKDKTPLLDREYGPITIGKHNSIFIGGVYHELGHALSLPHCMQRSDEAVRGTALMGAGNRTYADERRDEGLGTFLTQANALRLAAHPAFNAKVPQSVYDRPMAKWSDMSIETKGERLIVSGKLKSNVPAHSVLAYFDAPGRGDYDSTTATFVPDEEGNFRLLSDKLAEDWQGEIRIFGCHVNGATSRISKTHGPEE